MRAVSSRVSAGGSVTPGSGVTSIDGPGDAASSGPMRYDSITGSTRTSRQRRSTSATVRLATADEGEADLGLRALWWCRSGGDLDAVGGHQPATAEGRTPGAPRGSAVLETLRIVAAINVPCSLHGGAVRGFAGRPSRIRSPETSQRACQAAGSRARRRRSPTSATCVTIRSTESIRRVSSSRVGWNS